MDISSRPPKSEPIVTDLKERARRLVFNEDHIQMALYRAMLVYAAALLDLLFKEGKLSPTEKAQLEALGDEVLDEMYANDKDKVEELTKCGMGFVKPPWVDISKHPPSNLMIKMERLKKAVVCISQAQTPWLRGRTSSSNVRMINVEVKISRSGCPMDGTETRMFTDQLETYTTAVVIWNILKDQTTPPNDLGPCLCLYDASKWFPSVLHSKPIRELYRNPDIPDAVPLLYVVDENDEYVVATLIEKTHKSDPGIHKKGIVLRLDKRTLKDALADEKLSGVLEFQVRSSMKTLPLSTTLTKPKRPLTAFSSDYDIVTYSGSGVGPSTVGSTSGGLFKGIRNIFICFG